MFKLFAGLEPIATLALGMSIFLFPAGCHILPGDKMARVNLPPVIKRSAGDTFTYPLMIAVPNPYKLGKDGIKFVYQLLPVVLFCFRLLPEFPMQHNQKGISSTNQNPAA